MKEAGVGVTRKFPLGTLAYYAWLVNRTVMFSEARELMGELLAEGRTNLEARICPVRAY